MKFNRHYLRSKNYYAKEILGFLFILFAIYFFRHEGHELRSLGGVLQSSNRWLLLIGLSVTALYAFSHALMYSFSFKTIGSKILWTDGLKLFLKRNFVSVFLPGGGVTSLAFFSKEIENKGVSQTKINLASYIYGLIGILTVFLVTIPVIIYLLFTRQHLFGELIAFGVLTLTIILLTTGTISLFKKGWLYKKILAFKPDTELILDEIAESDFSISGLIWTILISLGIEFLGIAHLLIAMYALGLEGHFDAAIVGYVIATLFLVISPFLKGLGAVELSLVLVLQTYGFSATQAAAVTFLYRLFEFWLPMLAGAMSFILNKGNLFLRIFPAMLLFTLGIVDIVSVLTPALGTRIQLLSDFLPIEALRLSNGLVLLIGVLQLITSAFLLRGMRSAWNISVILCILAIAGNLTKGLDYEEAILAFAVLFSLWLTRKQYYVRANRNLQNFSLGVSLWIFAAVTVYGIVGFYFLDQKHFGIDFSLTQSVSSTFDNFIFLNTGGLEPRTHFAHLFLYSIRVLGAGSILLVFYGSIKPYLFEDKAEEDEFLLAEELLQKHGNSAVDYFKTYSDKLFFFAEDRDGFISYRIGGDFAIALGTPVCAPDIQTSKRIILEYEEFCLRNGLKPAYYRIDRKGLEVFDLLNKKNIIIGQEAIVDLTGFTMEGGNRKSLRNAVSSVLKKGYKLKIYDAPIKAGILQKLEHVSNNWLSSLERVEMVFSQGIFDAEEISKQTVLALENEDEKIVAFLNIIPDYVPGELTYDLIRKTDDAPGGNMDVLIVELIAYAKEKGYTKLNLGMAPMSGIIKGRDLPERTIKFSYEKLRSFRHYHGLRDFKEKFSPEWDDEFLVYDNHYDLLRLPVALNTVMKP